MSQIFLNAPLHKEPPTDSGRPADFFPEESEEPVAKLGTSKIFQTVSEKSGALKIRQQVIGKSDSNEIAQQAIGQLMPLQIGQSATDHFAISEKASRKLGNPFTIKDPEERSFYDIEATKTSLSRQTP